VRKEGGISFLKISTSASSVGLRDCIPHPFFRVETKAVWSIDGLVSFDRSVLYLCISSLSLNLDRVSVNRHEFSRSPLRAVRRLMRFIPQQARHAAQTSPLP